MLKPEEAKKPKKLKLGFCPYTYVRSTVMKSLLFRKEDYQKMLKMTFSEIAKFLQESHYNKEINELAGAHSGADLLELALNKNLAASFKKLIRISPPKLAMLITEYAIRKDIEDIKTILRGKFTKAPEKMIVNSITAAGTLSMDFLVSLLEKESVEEILKGNKIVPFYLLGQGLRDVAEKNTLVSIENAFDKYYYQSLEEFSKILPKQGALFRGFLTKEVEIINILTLLRLKKSKFGKDAIKSFIIPSAGAMYSKIISLAGADSLEQISEALEKTEYKGVIEKGIEDYRKSGSLITLETELCKYLLKESILLLHQHPLSIEVILGYMLAKDIEIRNLRVIIKGKQLGLREEFIERQLVLDK
ncbi:ATP synthase A1 subunit C [Candidatus Woesearchaeota archaeon]|nr:ATP synthase A1 subunit C [Candidatus Woesearchaeota archaeon]